MCQNNAPGSGIQRPAVQPLQLEGSVEGDDVSVGNECELLFVEIHKAGCKKREPAYPSVPSICRKAVKTHFRNCRFPFLSVLSGNMRHRQEYPPGSDGILTDEPVHWQWTDQVRSVLSYSGRNLLCKSVGIRPLFGHPGFPAHGL